MSQLIRLIYISIQSIALELSLKEELNQPRIMPHEAEIYNLNPHLPLMWTCKKKKKKKKKRTKNKASK
jgi:hypothetical protein